MNQSIFTTNVSFLPRVICRDNEIRTMTLANALLSPSWRSQVEAVRAEQDPIKQALLKSGLPFNPTPAQVEAFRAEQDPERRRQMKTGLPCFTPSGTFSRVCRAGLVRHSGYISIDIDCKPEKGINPGLVGYDLKAAIVSVPHIAYCGQSCRGAGYVILIPIADPSKHLQYFKALAYHFSRAGLEIDPACRDISRKRFVSWDADPYINTAAKPWALTLPDRDRAADLDQQRPAIPADLEETAAKVEAIIENCEAHEWDITADRGEWVRLLAALAITFQEGGRDYAHRISANYPGYTPEETDRNFDYFLANPPEDITIGTFFYIASKEMGKHDFDEIQPEA